MAGPEWKGLFEWSMKHSDGTRISDLTDIEIDRDKMEWLQEVLSNYVRDLVNRMKEIRATFEEKENQETDLKHQEALLDELQEIVESLDQSKNLHIIGGLPMLLDLLKSAQTSLKWRAAEIIATCVQNNLPVQKLFLQDGVLPAIMEVALDSQVQCQIKAWLAVASMIRNYPEAQNVFMDSYGLDPILNITKHDNIKLRKRGLLLLEYLLSHGEEARLPAVVQEGHLEAIVGYLENEDIDLRERTLSLIVAVHRLPQGPSLLHNISEFNQKLEKLETELESLNDEERETREQEIFLMSELRAVERGTPSKEQDKRASLPMLLK